MKSISKYFLFALLSMPLLFGCGKLRDFGDTNVNPNGSAVPMTANLLTNVLSGIGTRASSATAGYFCQYFSETQYPTASLYSLPPVDFGGLYSGAMFDLQNIILHNQNPNTIVQASLSGSNQNQIVIARILKCYYFWNITDQWGDVPYTEALNADPFTYKFKTLTPKYDSQEAIYKGLIAELQMMVDSFDVAGEQVKGDIVYNGDLTKWQKFANSMRLLMAVRLSKVYPNAGDYAAEQATLALAHPAGVIENEDDNFKLAYPGEGYKNPWFGTYESRNDLGESLFMVDLLNQLADPRQASFGSSTNGVPYGRNRASFMNAWFAANSTSYAKVLSDAYRSATSELHIIHSSAVYLARAEAKERGWVDDLVDPLSAKQAYEKGIETSFSRWGVSTGLGTYLTNPLVNFSNATNQAERLDKIALQKYIGLYPDGIQGWCEWRKSGVPALEPAQDATNVTKEIPRRLVYGTGEYSSNRSNVMAAADKIPLPVPTPAGATPGDTQDGRVWWDR